MTPTGQFDALVAELRKNQTMTFGGSCFSTGMLPFKESADAIEALQRERDEARERGDYWSDLYQREGEAHRKTIQDKAAAEAQVAALREGLVRCRADYAVALVDAERVAGLCRTHAMAEGAMVRLESIKHRLGEIEHCLKAIAKAAGAEG